MMKDTQESNKPTQYDCEMVKDLLPLYHDGVCSASSQGVVELHVQECETCRRELQRLKNDAVDLRLQQERHEVMAQHADHVKKEVKRKSLTVGTIMSAVFALPILVCLIVNLATSHALDWFFLVLASLVVVASVTVVPMLAPRKKALWTVGSFTLALHLLLVTVCLYVSGDWFWLVSVSVLLGMTIFVLPFVIHQKPLPGALKRHKGLVVMSLATGLLYLLLFVIGLFIGGRYADAAIVIELHASEFYESVRYMNAYVFWRNAFRIATACLPLPWLLFGTCRYLPITKRGKTGVILILCGLFTAVINDVIRRIIEGGVFRLRIFDVDYLHWTANNVNSNANLIVCVVCVVLGVFFLLAQGKRRSIDPQRANRKY